MSGPQWSPEHRRLARRLHPDLGGDPDVYIAAMRELDEQQAATTKSTGPAQPAGGGASTVGYATARTRTARAVVKRARTLTTVVRRRLPRSWPGARRYGRL